jgi:7-cyano-7-deazaguanine synthase
MRAIVLLSGGLDSYTAAAIARAEGYELYALTVQYGQRHVRELASAREVARALNVARHLELPIDLRAIGGSSLTSDEEVPRDRDLTTGGIPSTYVPARNTIFLALALAWAEAVRAFDIVIGVNALDYSGYPDCRPEFIHAFEQLAAVATRAGVEGARFTVHTPLIAWSKADIIRRGLALGLDYALRPLLQLRAARQRIRRGRSRRSPPPALESRPTCERLQPTAPQATHRRRDGRIRARARPRGGMVGLSDPS